MDGSSVGGSSLTGGFEDQEDDDTDIEGALASGKAQVVHQSVESQFFALPELAEGSVFASTIGETLAAGTYFDAHRPAIVNGLFTPRKGRLELVRLPKSIHERVLAARRTCLVRLGFADEIDESEDEDGDDDNVEDDDEGEGEEGHSGGGEDVANSSPVVSPATAAGYRGRTSSAIAAAAVQTAVGAVGAGAGAARRPRSRPQSREPAPFDIDDPSTFPTYGDVYLWLVEEYGVFPIALLRHGVMSEHFSSRGSTAAHEGGRTPAPSTVRGYDDLAPLDAMHNYRPYVYTCPRFEARVGPDDMVFVATHEMNSSPAWRATIRLQRWATRLLPAIRVARKQLHRRSRVPAAVPVPASSLLQPPGGLVHHHTIG